MFNFLNPEAANPTPQQIARFFRLLGWIGFWLQSLLGFIPILVVVTAVLFSPNRQQSGGLSFGLFSAIACLLLMIFSIYWCFRYTRLARKLASRDLRPAKSQVIRDLKLGLIANIGSMAIAVPIAMARVGELTFKMLTLPQGATIITPTSNQARAVVAQGAMITPSDMIAIQAMVNTIASGLVGIVVALLLLYLVRQNHIPQER
jgi:mannose/fructose/N-acetylgalactosamine-specific phosphotransferase system component IID